MATYEVTIRETEVYIVEVEANNDFEAEDQAWKKLEQEGRDGYHNDSDSDVEICEID